MCPLTGRSHRPSTPLRIRPTPATRLAKYSDTESPSLPGPGFEALYSQRTPSRHRGTSTASSPTPPRPHRGAVTDTNFKTTPFGCGTAYAGSVIIPTWSTSIASPFTPFVGCRPKNTRSPCRTSFKSSTGSAKWCCWCVCRGMNTGLTVELAKADWMKPGASKDDGPMVPPCLYVARSWGVRAAWLVTNATTFGMYNRPRWPRYLRLARRACSSVSRADSWMLLAMLTHPRHESSRSSTSTTGLAYELKSSVSCTGRSHRPADASVVRTVHSRSSHTSVWERSLRHILWILWIWTDPRNARVGNPP